jgi:hypothetical protein
MMGTAYSIRIFVVSVIVLQLLAGKWTSPGAVAAASAKNSSNGMACLGMSEGRNPSRESQVRGRNV